LHVLQKEDNDCMKKYILDLTSIFSTVDLGLLQLLALWFHCTAHNTTGTSTVLTHFWLQRVEACSSEQYKACCNNNNRIK